MYTSYFDIILDVINVVPIPLKLFSMYIVYRHSPANMDSLPYFILNTMAWDFLTSLSGIVLHYIPAAPFVCFRATGLITLFINNEVVYHLCYMTIIASAANATLAQFFAFPYRYMVIVHPDFVDKLKKTWIVALCIGLHVFYVILIYICCYLIIVPYDDYPFAPKKPPARVDVFCFQAHGSLRESFVMMASGITASIGILTVLFTILLYRHFQKMVHLYSKQTLEMHRKFLRYLVVITALPILCAIWPQVVGGIQNALFPQYGLENFMFTTALIYAQGTFFCIRCILCFAPYRQAVGKMGSSAFSQNSVVSTVVISGIN
ncbi:hypothetical protein QR680_015459 [Steinernema hermaphroditum]|uniref:Uncharacterized protein n=1 Tax=Steinernema hermaphroditum TaxID=289476 RepID=A0AA39LKL9_9BILA|nr:hypothetical protein QR680_015459 [Steinernema hermaphroditum]